MHALKYLIVILLLSMTGACTPDAPTVAMKVGIAIPSYVHAVAWIAEDKGFFQNHGLDTEVVVMGGSSATMKGLVSGDIQLGLAGGDAVIKANLAGADLVILGGLVNKHYHRLVARKGISSPEDLRGKTIGLPFLGGPQDFLVHVLCKRWGLSYGEDVAIRNMGKEFARLVAITKGEVDAITSAANTSKLDELGLEVLADPRGWDEAAPYMQFVVAHSFLKDHPDRVEAALRALAEASAFYLSEQDDALTVVFEELGTKKGDPAEAYLEAGPLHYDIPPLPEMTGLANTFAYIAALPDHSASAESRNVTEFVDDSLVRSLVAEGVFAPAAAAQKTLAKQDTLH